MDNIVILLSLLIVYLKIWIVSIKKMGQLKSLVVAKMNHRVTLIMYSARGFKS